MGLESASYISQLVPTNPTGGDPKSSSDDHHRLIKTVLQIQFPNLGATAVTVTAAEINASIATATAAAAAAGATVFNAATAYAQYAAAISTLSLQTYRRNTAGTSATDPSLDSTNWTLITGNSQTDAATWTPSVGGTATYTSRVGRYTKIGKFVYIEGFIQINTIGTGSTFQISGLPFVSNSTTGTGAVTISLWSGTATAVTSVFGQVDSNASTITLRSTTVATSAPGANAIFANGTYIYFSGQYTTA